MSDIKYMDIKEFRDNGYLMEANRLFFHPLGLALEVVLEEDGSFRLGGIWDSRDDPEGMIFDEGMLDEEDFIRSLLIEIERLEKACHRRDKLGYIIQPFD